MSGARSDDLNFPIQAVVRSVDHLDVSLLL
jgi:hypothetical protein